MTQEYQFQRPEGVQVTYRRMKFDFEEQGFDRYWQSGSPFKSLFWTQLSTAFGPGETFFIDSARGLRDKLQDSQLLAELQEFARQEGHHTAQHRKFDKMNAALGIDVETCKKRYAWILNRTRRLSPIEMLATTVALEHFTSCFADQYFSNVKISEHADPKVLALWGWHAAEELEHRGTCFDVYTAAGGKYWMRCVHLVCAWSLILGISLINTAYLLKRDGKLFTRDTLKGLGYLFGRKGVVTGLLPAFFSFFSPRFHPWRGIDGAEIAKWASENRRYMASLPDAA